MLNFKEKTLLYSLGFWWLIFSGLEVAYGASPVVVRGEKQKSAVQNEEADSGLWRLKLEQRTETVENRLMNLEEKIKVAGAGNVSERKIQELREQLKNLDKRQVELNSQWLDLKTSIETLFKQNQQLQSFIFQELKAAEESQQFLKTELLKLCELVKENKAPFTMKAWLESWGQLLKSGAYYYYLGSFVACLLVFLGVKKLSNRKSRRKTILRGKKKDYWEQLNLAKAYLELEEKENAKVLLEEIILNCNGELKDDAVTLLNQLTE